MSSLKRKADEMDPCVLLTKRWDEKHSLNDIKSLIVSDIKTNKLNFAPPLRIEDVPHSPLVKLTYPSPYHAQAALERFRKPGVWYGGRSIVAYFQGEFAPPPNRDKPIVPIVPPPPMMPKLPQFNRGQEVATRRAVSTIPTGPAADRPRPSDRDQSSRRVERDYYPIDHHHSDRYRPSYEAGTRHAPKASLRGGGQSLPLSGANAEPLDGKSRLLRARSGYPTSPPIKKEMMDDVEGRKQAEAEADRFLQSLGLIQSPQVSQAGKENGGQLSCASKAYNLRARTPPSLFSYENSGVRSSSSERLNAPSGDQGIIDRYIPSARAAPEMHRWKLDQELVERGRKMERAEREAEAREALRSCLQKGFGTKHAETLWQTFDASGSITMAVGTAFNAGRLYNALELAMQSALGQQGQASQPQPQTQPQTQLEEGEIEGEVEI